MKAEAPLSILAVTLRYPPYVAGGYELLTRDAVEALRARGHRVQVLAGRGSRFDGVEGVLPWLAPELEQDGREADLFGLSFAGSNLDRFRLHFFRLANYLATRRALERTGAEVLLFFNLGLVSLAPVLAARHVGLPTVGYVADPWPTNHWLSAWRGAAADAVKPARLHALTRLWHGFRGLVGLGPLLACSRHLLRTLQADALAAEDLEVLHLGVPPDVAAAARDQPSPERPRGAPLRVVCLSSLWRGKGQHVLLEAARRARGAGCDVEVVLAGPAADPAYRSELEELSRTPELTGAVTFAGELDRERLSQLLGTAHVLAMPSLWHEPFGLATLEGMAHGLAVLTSDTGASPEIVTDGETGLVLAAGNEAAWSEALQCLERDEEFRLGLGGRGREHVNRDLTHGRFVDGLESALARALGRRRA